MLCLLCQKPVQIVFEINEYDIYECWECEHRMIIVENSKQHLNKIYSDDYFYSGGDGYPNYVNEREILIRHGHYYGKLLSKYIDIPGKVLDVGSAAGFILKGLTDYGWMGSGIEVNDKMAGYGRENLGLDIQTGSIENFKKDDKYDLICFIQVIAHLIDPSNALKTASTALSEKGYVLIETWDYKSLTAKLFGKLWHEYSPPSVTNWFSERSLNAMMKNLNFELISKGHPDKRISFIHAKSLIKYKIDNNSIFRHLTAFLDALPENWTVPYPGNDLFWALYKKLD